MICSDIDKSQKRKIKLFGILQSNNFQLTKKIKIL